MNGPERIIKKIHAEAEEEVTRILAEAEAECAAIHARWKLESEQKRAALVADAEQKGAELVARAKATSAAGKTQAILKTRAELVDDVFEKTFDSIRNQSAEQYTTLLSGLLSAALVEQAAAEEYARTHPDEDSVFPDRYEVILSPQDRERYGKRIIESARTKLAGKPAGALCERLVLADKSRKTDGGLILRCGDVEINCTFPMLFAELRHTLEGDVSRALFDAVRPV